MKKVITNFLMDILLFVVLMSQAFTGILLHRFPPELADQTILGITRYSWGTFHWVASLLFVIVIITHLILHWGWMTATTQKYFRMTSKALLGFLIILSVFILLTPFYLTRDYPDRKDARGTSVEWSSLDTAIQKVELPVRTVSQATKTRFVTFWPDVTFTQNFTTPASCSILLQFQFHLLPQNMKIIIATVSFLIPSLYYEQQEHQ